MSFANIARALRFFVIRSTVISIDVFIVSVIKTKEILKPTKYHSNMLILQYRPKQIVKIALKIQMLNMLIVFVN